MARPRHHKINLYWLKKILPIKNQRNNLLCKIHRSKQFSTFKDFLELTFLKKVPQSSRRNFFLNFLEFKIFIQPRNGSTFFRTAFATLIYFGEIFSHFQVQWTDLNYKHHLLLTPINCTIWKHIISPSFYTILNQ